MSVSKRKLHLSPSALHQYLVKQTEQKLAYRGGDVRQWQRKLRKKLRQLVGEIPKERVALEPRTLWRRDH